MRGAQDIYIPPYTTPPLPRYTLLGLKESNNKEALRYRADCPPEWQIDTGWEAQAWNSLSLGGW